MDMYDHNFAVEGFHTLEDLHGKLNEKVCRLYVFIISFSIKFLESIGISSMNDIKTILGAYVEWSNVTTADRLSSLESIDSGVAYSAPIVAQSSSSIRVAKTTIRSTYRVPKKRPRH